MRMQTEVPSSLESHKGRFATNPTRTFLADALKADRNHRITFCGPRGSYEIVRAISFNAGQISLYARRISLYAGQISFNAGTHRPLILRYR